ncbi:MAG TPA: O-antigen ligase family protein, partial [Ktedonobacterales bacterium]|nr:O-antigen ligase family protein [Ktedonobacterales bacterium]
VLKWSEVTVVVALTLLLARTERYVRLIVWALIVAGIAEALLGCAQWALSAGAAGPGGSGIRVFGTFSQPNPYGGYLNFALPLALALTLFGRDARERWVAGGASVVLLMAQAFADSRGAELGLAAALVVIVVVGLRYERLAGLIALIGAPVVAIAWFVHLIPQRIETALLDQARVNGTTLSCAPNSGVNDANFSTVERLAHWVAGIRMFLAHPLLGVGAGNYNAAYAHYTIPCWPEPLGHAHNYYINAAAETGLLGLLTFLALMGASLYLGWRATHTSAAFPASPTRFSFGDLSLARLVTTLAERASANTTGRALALGLFAVLVALSVHNLTDDLFVHAMELQFALCLGCLVRLAKPQNTTATASGTAPSTVAEAGIRASA